MVIGNHKLYDHDTYQFIVDYSWNWNGIELDSITNKESKNCINMKIEY